ncbi:MAG: heavy metal transporter [Nitratiruptor sp.]|nr:heavy metal transporter [Nitratiruptor sp.]
MRRSFALANVRCAGCARTIERALSPHFGPVHVDLTQMPRIVTVELKGPEEEARFKEILISLGYPLIDERLSTGAAIGAKARSLVSCAIGKFTLAKGEENGSHQSP